MPGELIPIGRRPKLVASFAGPGSAERFQAWLDANGELLTALSPTDFKVEYSSAGSERVIRVRVEETALPSGLEGPNEAGAADGLPPSAA